MKKKIIVVLIGLVLIAGGVWYSTKHPSVTTPTSSIAGAILGPGGDFTHETATDFYKTKAVFPSKTSLSHDADIKARTTMENWIVSAETDFKQMSDDMLSPEE